MDRVRFANLSPDLYGPIRIPCNRTFEVVGSGYFYDDNDVLYATLSVVHDASLTSLKHAYVRFAREHEALPDDPMEMLISPAHPESFDPDYASFLNTRLKVSGDRIAVIFTSPTTDSFHDRKPLRRLLAPLLKRSRASLVDISGFESPEGSAVDVEIEVSTRGRTVGDAVAIGEQAEALVEAATPTGR